MKGEGTGLEQFVMRLDVSPFRPFSKGKVLITAAEST